MAPDDRHRDDERGFDGPFWAYPPLRNGLFSGLLVSVGFLLTHLELQTAWMEAFFYVLAIPIGGYHWTREGLKALTSKGEVGIDLLMLAATGGSAALGLWDEAAFLVFLYGTAEGLEAYTYARTRSAIRGLLDLAPREARLLEADETRIVAVEQLKTGDCFHVRPGEAIPTDGIIQSGRSSLDESPITGESVPVDKGPGDIVFAGSINRQGSLTVKATATFHNNTLSKMIHLVQDAQAQKGRAQQWIDRFGRRYSPAVLATSFLMAVIPWLLGLPVAGWSLRAVVLLVAAAPCALVMSMPVAVAAGIGAAGKRGILIKGGVHLEHLGVIRVVAFDKTGTLTHGLPVVSDLITLKGRKADWLSAAAGLEHHSEHPLGKAILDKAGAEGASPAEITRFEALTGAGARGVMNGKHWYIGSPDLFQRMDISLKAVSDRIKILQTSGKTVVLVGTEQALYGIIALKDQIRPEAPEAIARLHRMGMNDAPALAAATCGMAMGAAGSDAAIEAADVALMADDLKKVEDALRLGRRARRISRENICLSLLILAVLIPSAVSGGLSVAGAVLYHEMSELMAVANGLRTARLS